MEPDIMKTRQWARVCCALTLLTGCAATAAAQADRASACSITIDTPRTGEKHGPEVLVTGTAKIPPGRYLYTFVHRRGLALWWPAGGGAATIERGSGSFATLATLGLPRDIGAEFELLAQIVDDSEHTRLQQWFKRAEESGQYPGISRPPFVEGCGAPPRVMVTKTR
jgi:hypothetical protein